MTSSYKFASLKMFPTFGTECLPQTQIFTFNICDGGEPNLCRVKQEDVSATFC